MCRRSSFSSVLFCWLSVRHNFDGALDSNRGFTVDGDRFPAPHRALPRPLMSKAGRPADLARFAYVGILVRVLVCRLGGLMDV